MKLQKSGNNDCLPYAFAMACDVEIKDFFNTLGKEGYNVQWEDLPNPKCYRGWHLQECMIAAWCFDKVCMPIYKHYILGHDDEHIVQFQQENFPNFNIGVLILETHAVAYEDTKIYDPKGKIYDYEDMIPEIKILISDLI